MFVPERPLHPPGTDALTYYEKCWLTAVKSFIMLAPDVSIYILNVIYIFSNQVFLFKWRCFAQYSLLSLEING
jgi:hypothetical protein